MLEPHFAALVKEVEHERTRQEMLVAANQDSGWCSCADPNTSDEYRLAVLGEEFGEVCKALNEVRTGEGNQGQVRQELIEVAAVALAWVEGIDSEYQ